MTLPDSPHAAISAPDCSLSVSPTPALVDDADCIARNAQAKEWYWTDPSCDPVNNFKALRAATVRHTILDPNQDASSSSAPPTRLLKCFPWAGRYVPARKPPVPPPAQPILSRHTLPSIPLMPLDARMQAYFFRMQSVARRTCHPREIRRQTDDIVARIAGDDGASVDAAAWACRLFFAGIAKLEYSRSVAVLVSQVTAELVHDVQAKPSSLTLCEELLILARGAFSLSWKDADLDFLECRTGLEPIHVVLETTRTQLLNIAAFLGDLFAVGVLPMRSFYKMASLLVNDPRSMAHCRALHLLLLRASLQVPVREDVSVRMLLCWRQALVCKAMCEERHLRCEMWRKWLVEICNIIDGMGGGHRTANGISCHRWDTSLSGQIMASLLEDLPAMAQDAGLFPALIV